MVLRVFCLPDTRPGTGTGHVLRSARLCGFFSNASLVGSETEITATLKKNGVDVPRILSVSDFLSNLRQGDCAILDYRSLDADLMPLVDATLEKASYVIALDAVGALSSKIPFIIDTLARANLEPKISGSAAYNIKFRGLFLPLNSHNTVVNPQEKEPKLLISFGGEDPNRSSQKLLESLLERKIQRNLTQIDVVVGVNFTKEYASVLQMLSEQCQKKGVSIRILPTQKKLLERLEEYTSVITHYGLTALEAHVAGLCVYLMDPSPYHAKLAEIDRFTHASDPSMVWDFVEDNKYSPPRLELDPANDQHKFVQFIKSMAHPAGHRCPACRSKEFELLDRLVDQSFFRCTSCGIWYQQLFGPQTIAYHESYFFDDYKKQYGKTYLDDFEHIKKLGLQRLQAIKKTQKGVAGTLLDIGCAYGPFLAAAKDQGYTVYGVDISTDAITYVRDTLGFPSLSGDFMNMDLQEISPPFDVVSMWYVIEHLRDLRGALQKVSELVGPEGIFAFSTPSAFGISARARLKSFLKNSPRDHYTIWTRRSLKIVMRQFGFKLVRLRSTGHHPERFPIFGAYPLFHPLLRRISRIFKLGDTFEAYFKKEGS